MTTRMIWLVRSGLAVGMGAVALGLAILPLRQSSAATAAGVHPGPMSRTDAFARAETLTALGRKIFSDPSLSASGLQACASCHDPAHAFGPASATPIEMGGEHLDQPGLRAVPTLRYLQSVPAFTEHYYDSRGRGRRKRRQRPDGRPDLGRPGRSRRRSGEDPAAFALRDGQQGCGRGSGEAAEGRLCRRYQGDIRRDGVRQSSGCLRRRGRGARHLRTERPGFLSLFQPLRCLSR